MNEDAKAHQEKRWALQDRYGELDKEEARIMRGGINLAPGDEYDKLEAILKEKRELDRQLGELGFFEPSTE